MLKRAVFQVSVRREGTLGCCSQLWYPPRRRCLFLITACPHQCSDAPSCSSPLSVSFDFRDVRRCLSIEFLWTHVFALYRLCAWLTSMRFEKAYSALMTAFISGFQFAFISGFQFWCLSLEKLSLGQLCDSSPMQVFSFRSYPYVSRFRFCFFLCLKLLRQPRLNFGCWTTSTTFILVSGASTT